MTLLFVEFWQHECCGDPFGVGDAVVWPVTPVEGDGLVSLLGVELGQQLHLAVDRHEEQVRTVTGRVLSIRAVFAEHEAVVHPTEGTYHRPRPGSAQLRTIDRTQRRERLADLHWTGYVVDVSIDDSPAGTA